MIYPVRHMAASLLLVSVITNSVLWATDQNNNIILIVKSQCQNCASGKKPFPPHCLCFSGISFITWSNLDLADLYFCCNNPVDCSRITGQLGCLFPKPSFLRFLTPHLSLLCHHSMSQVGRARMSDLGRPAQKHWDLSPEKTKPGTVGEVSARKAWKEGT